LTSDNFQGFISFSQKILIFVSGNEIWRDFFWRVNKFSRYNLDFSLFKGNLIYYSHKIQKPGLVVSTPSKYFLQELEDSNTEI